MGHLTDFGRKTDQTSGQGLPHGSSGLVEGKTRQSHGVHTPETQERHSRQDPRHRPVCACERSPERVNNPKNSVLATKRQSYSTSPMIASLSKRLY